MQIGTIMRKMYDGKGLSVRSFMHTPSAIPGFKSTLAVACSPVVYFSFNPKYEKGKERPKDNSFKMNPRNQYRVNAFFKEILQWFGNPNYKDLFITDEREGRLMVNMDFRDTKALVRGSRYDTQVMMALPTVVTIDSVQSEGCVLYINRTDYAIALRDSDVEEIYGILDGFSFQGEMSLLMYIASHPELVTQQDFAGDDHRKVQW